MQSDKIVLSWMGALIRATLQLPQGVAMNTKPHAGQAQIDFHGPRPDWYTVDVILTFDFPRG
ncbi:hypothetical protein DK842_13380 [Chromobacterium phragmitis]|uniref:Uncharacterized protein n=1 Tax=Chromobacterium phragmitis TaxID=2202141 RepID=A0A344ULM2_9NEIS|nr:hypothetical protein DK842_13380 [Chromobacterium phragmitis]AXE36170.1 hypothetical protein DK843_18835 [Chromobacterium phragmitis]